MLARIWLLSALAGAAGGPICAQEQLPPPPLATPLHEEAVPSPVAGCVEPPPMVRLEDYDGPFKKTVGTLAGPLERKSVHPPRYKPGAMLCTLKWEAKFVLFVQDSIDPVTFLGGAFDAGLDQAQDTDPSYGQGAQGYGKRLGAELAGGATSRFFKDFAFPSLFSEDPRYYRLARGSGKRRLLHAIQHAVVAHRDDGTRMFNFTEWLGTTSAVVLSNTYHPDAQRGFASAAERVGSSILQDVGYDVLREFWPEISHKFKLPFRGESQPASSASESTSSTSTR